MALFIININQQGGNLDNPDELRIYYGTVSTIPNDSTSVQNLPYNEILDSSIVERQIDTNSNKHVIAIPNNINIDTIVDTGNSYEDITDEYILYNNNLTVTINGNDYDYVLFLMTTGRSYENETIHYTFLQNV